MMNRKATKYDVLGIIITLVCIGIWANYKSSKYVEYQLFVQTKGTIISKEIEHNSKLYLPKITYQYEVNGKKYICNVVSIFKTNFFPQRFEKQNAMEVLKMYEINQEVDVYYSEKNPENALLVKGSIEINE